MNIKELLKKAAVDNGYVRGRCGIDNMRIAREAGVSSDDVRVLLGTHDRKPPPLSVLVKIATVLHVDGVIMDYLVNGDSMIKPAVTAKLRKKKTAFDTRKYSRATLLHRLRQHGVFTGTKAELIALLTNGKNDISEPTLRRYLNELKHVGEIRYIITIGKVEITFPGRLVDNGKDYGNLRVQQMRRFVELRRSLR
ncbi:hypothetical protein MQG48_003952 [Escherichia coli]|nr:hypothetical protein [Escherichia coli]